MATTTVTKTIEPTTVTPVKTLLTEAKATVAEGTLKIDAAETVYGTAKGIFSWSKSVPVVSIFAGVTEAVAEKALGVVGTDLKAVDEKLASELAKMDAHILNPAVDQIGKVMFAVSEDIIKPIVIQFISPFKMIKSKVFESTPKAHVDETPEVTSLE